MLNINNYMFTGRLTRDPEVRNAGDTTICAFTVAVSNRYQDRSGEWKDDTAFLDVKVFGKTADRVAEFSKGQPVYVEGRIKQENWEKDGQKRSKIVVNAAIVKAFEVAQKGHSGGSGAGYRDTPAAPSRVQQFSASPEADDDIPF